MSPVQHSSCLLLLLSWTRFVNTSVFIYPPTNLPRLVKWELGSAFCVVWEVALFKELLMLLTPVVNPQETYYWSTSRLPDCGLSAREELGAENLGRSEIRKPSTAYAVQRIFLEWLTIRLGVILIYDIIWDENRLDQRRSHARCWRWKSIDQRCSDLRVKSTVRTANILKNEMNSVSSQYLRNEESIPQILNTAETIYERSSMRENNLESERAI
jgi:hypothetical protein